MAQAYAEFRNPRRADRQRIDKVIAALGKKRARDIRQVDLVAAANLLHPESIAATKNREVVRPVAAILHYAAKSEICDWVKFSPFREPKPKTRAVSDDVAQTLIEAVPHGPKRLFLVWVFHQGTRISDTLRVAWEDIDLAQRVVRVHVSKTDSDAEFPLCAETLAQLALVPEPERVGKLFPWQQKTGVYRWLRPLVRELGVSFTPHMARHTLGKRMAESGASLRAIMGALGHASVASSIRYQSVDTEALRAAMERAVSLPKPVSPKRGPLSA